MEKGCCRAPWGLQLALPPLRVPPLGRARRCSHHPTAYLPFPGSALLVYKHWEVAKSFPVPNWCKLPHVWKQKPGSARLSTSQSHFPLSVFMYFFRCMWSLGLWKCHTSKLSCLTYFTLSITKNLRPGKKWKQKRYTWIGNNCMDFSVVATI